MQTEVNRAKPNQIFINEFEPNRKKPKQKRQRTKSNFGPNPPILKKFEADPKNIIIGLVSGLL